MNENSKRCGIERQMSSTLAFNKKDIEPFFMCAVRSGIAGDELAVKM